VPQNSPQPRLVDPARLARARARARLDQAGFLHDEAKAELQERLIDVNRRFTAPALVTAFPRYWADLVPGARLVAPDEVLDLTPGAHDLVIHAMALHWADDPVGQIVQCRRALAPDGLFLSAAFGGETLVELRTALAQAETEVLGGLSPRVAPMAEIRDMGALLQRAGLALPVADRLPKTVTYPDVFALMADLRAMGETNALADRHRRPPPRALFARLSKVYASRFPAMDDEKRIRASFEIVFLSGWAPHESQQIPLRPGAAKARLADALGTSEFDVTARPVLHPSDD
jgi:SAM-dependent methyltransferase